MTFYGRNYKSVELQNWNVGDVVTAIDPMNNMRRKMEIVYVCENTTGRYEAYDSFNVLDVVYDHEIIGLA
jgi:hypothetical protein